MADVILHSFGRTAALQLAAVVASQKLTGSQHGENKQLILKVSALENRPEGPIPWPTGDDIWLSTLGDIEEAGLSAREVNGMHSLIEPGPRI